MEENHSGKRKAANRDILSGKTNLISKLEQLKSTDFTKKSRKCNRSDSQHQYLNERSPFKDQIHTLHMQVRKSPHWNPSVEEPGEMTWKTSFRRRWRKRGPMSDPINNSRLLSSSSPKSQLIRRILRQSDFISRFPHNRLSVPKCNDMPIHYGGEGEGASKGSVLCHC